MARSRHQPSVWLLVIVLAAASQLRALRAQSSFSRLGLLSDRFPELGGGVMVHKRLFLHADCRGSYAPHFDGYISRVHNICKECADMYPGMREFISTNCTSECFRNRVFQDCLSATMQLHQLDEIHNMIGQLSGRKK